MYRIFWEGLGGENTAQAPVKQKEKVGNFTISMSSAVMGRLGVLEPEKPPFLAEKIERLRDTLNSKQKWLESARSELTARKERVKYFKTTLRLAQDGDWDAVIRYKSQISALPPRPPTRKTRKVPRVVCTSTA